MKDKYLVEAGDYTMTLSEGFLLSRDAMCNLENIKALFIWKYEIFTAMETEEDDELLRVFADLVWENEKNIMMAFNFEPNRKFFRFWEMKKCTCPVMDNQDYWGTDLYIYSGDCRIHGGFNE